MDRNRTPNPYNRGASTCAQGSAMEEVPTRTAQMAENKATPLLAQDAQTDNILADEGKGGMEAGRADTRAPSGATADVHSTQSCDRVRHARCPKRMADSKGCVPTDTMGSNGSGANCAGGCPRMCNNSVRTGDSGPRDRHSAPRAGRSSHDLEYYRDSPRCTAVPHMDKEAPPKVVEASRAGNTRNARGGAAGGQSHDATRHYGGSAWHDYRNSDDERAGRTACMC